MSLRKYFEAASHVNVYQHPGWLLLILASSIFVAEMAIMRLVGSMNPFSSLGSFLLFDSAMLVIAVSPILYFFSFRPIMVHMGMLKTNEQALKKAKEELEATVAERTAELKETNSRLQDELASRESAEEELLRSRNGLEAKVVERTSELISMNRELGERAVRLERLNQEIDTISRMNEFLQTCLSFDEAYSVISRTASQLFPADSGALLMFNSSRNILEYVTHWGEKAPVESAFAPSECWALRRGKTYSDGESGAGLACMHLNEGTGNHLCIPMVAYGETIGVLRLMAPEANGEAWALKKRLFKRFSGQVGLALANLKLRHTLKNLSIRDPLTGLFNRRYMEESLERELHLADRKNSTLGVIMIDIDHFKTFNDTFGHKAGDAVLREIGAFLRNNVRKSDIACRYGGEEFTLILPEASPEMVSQRAEYLRQAVKQLNIQNGGQSLGGITLSLGVAVYPASGVNSDSLLKSADDALYAAKAAGRDRVVQASDSQRDGISPEHHGNLRLVAMH